MGIGEVIISYRWKGSWRDDKINIFNLVCIFGYWIRGCYDVIVRFGFCNYYLNFEVLKENKFI